MGSCMCLLVVGVLVDDGLEEVAHLRAVDVPVEVDDLLVCGALALDDRDDLGGPRCFKVRGELDRLDGELLDGGAFWDGTTPCDRHQSVPFVAVKAMVADKILQVLKLWLVLTGAVSAAVVE